MSDKTFYVTTPIYYVNARPHIGHAYTTIVADVLARRHRLLGEETFFLTGTDEHGQKIERSAAAANIPPQQFADQVSKTFSDLWQRMGITNNAYIRTTSPAHKQGVQHLFSELYKNGFIYLSTYTGAYCVSDEAFVDAPVGTPCPDCGRLLESVTEENFFFKLSAFQKPLLDLIESNTLQITPDSRRNEVLSFLRGIHTNVINEFVAEAAKEGVDLRSAYSREEIRRTAIAGGRLMGNVQFSSAGLPYAPQALRDLSISRSSFTWGIPVPDDVQQAADATQKHVIYVWLDALANYITALGYGSNDETLFKKFWPANIHLVGKEIIRFHCVYWPAFLLALNPEAAQPPATQTPLTDTPGAPGPASGTRVSTNPHPPQLTLDQHKAWAEKWLPKAVTAHGWLLFEESKMSKSRGNIVRTETILEGFGTLCPNVLKGTNLSTDTSALKGTGFSPSENPSNDAALAAEGISTGSSSGLQPTESDPNQKGALAPGFSEPTKQDRDLFASDVLRYFLLREIPFGQDGNFSFDAMITRYNADLANGYGNLVSRTLNMISKYFDGRVPPAIDVSRIEETYTQEPDGPTKAPGLTAGLAVGLVEGWRREFDDLQFSKLVEYTWRVVGAMDGVISDMAPWKLAVRDDERSQTRLCDVLYVSAEAIRIITALVYPILPYATAKVWKQLGFEKSIEQAAADGELTNLEWGGLKPGTKLGPLSPIFPRADKGLAKIMTDMENPTPVDTFPADPAAVPPTADPAAAPRTSALSDPATTLPVGGSTALTTGPTPLPTDSHLASPPLESPHITIDDFAKIELRVAEIKLAERIPKADKLLRLEVDLGTLGQRQILSGIAEWYAPEDLIGRRIIVITNLAPRKMRGLESHGMLLAASQEGGKPYLATVPEGVPIGTRLK